MERGNDKKALPLKQYIFFGLIFIVITIGTYYFLNKNMNLEFNFEKISPLLIVSLTVMMVIMLLLDASRFKTILYTMNIRDVSFKYCIKMAIIGICVSNLTPFTAGGSIAQIYFLNKNGLKTGDAIAVTSLKSMMASFFFFATLPIVLSLNTQILGGSLENIQKFLPYLTGLYLVAMAVLLWLSFHHEKIDKKMLKWSENRKKEKSKRRALLVSKEVSFYFESIKRFISADKRYIVMTFLFTSLHFLFIFSFSYVILNGIGYDFTIVEVGANQMISNFVMYFGFTPGGSGFAENSYAFLFSKLVTEEDLGLVILLWRTFTVYIITAMGIFVLISEINKIRKRSLSTSA